jgi:copper resistance protein B
VFKHTIACTLIAALWATTAALATAQAGTLRGKAKPDTVIPRGPINPSSGAPARFPKAERDHRINHYFLLDRAEYGFQNGINSYAWEGTGWIGNDYNKLWLKTEGSGPVDGGSPDSAQFQVKYGRAISPLFSAQIGLRYDAYPTPTQGFAVFDLQGLAPYWFEVENQLYVSQHGDVSFDGEYEYDLRFTQRLILQPRVEFTVAATDASRYGLGSGLRSTEMGLRLRYEIKREFAPYIGVRWEQQYGDTKDMAQTAGESTSSTAFVIGLRAWY